jgi:hypothetical protein
MKMKRKKEVSFVLLVRDALQEEAEFKLNSK